MARRTLFTLLAGLVLASGITTTVVLTSRAHAAPAPPACASRANLNDYQMNVCLTGEIARLMRAIGVEVSREARHVASSPREGQRVAATAQRAFERYARAECLAEANLYSGGTIYPIIFGDCEVSLLHQRLDLVRSVNAFSLAG